MANQRTELADWLDSLIGDGAKYSSNRRFADAVGISEDTVRRMLKGETPSLPTFQKIADAEPGVSLADLQRMAGILPRAEDEIREDILRVFKNVLNRLPEEDQQFILDMAKRMVERRRQEEQG